VRVLLTQNERYRGRHLPNTPLREDAAGVWACALVYQRIGPSASAFRLGGESWVARLGDT